jgi:hypothetical protein
VVQEYSTTRQASAGDSLREMAAWCRGFALESACPWTARLLKRLGKFQTALEAFSREQNAAPFKERAGEQFLYRMSAHTEPLVAAMARLELALMRMMQGSSDEYLVEWDRNPELVFHALRTGKELPPPEAGVRYRTYVSRKIPDLVRCEREEAALRSG